MTFTPAATHESLVSFGGTKNTPLTAAQIAAGITVIKAAPGRLCRIVVTTTTTAAQNITFFDNASAASGTVLAVVPGGSTQGTIIDLQVPAQNGLVVGQNASLAAGGITVSWA